MSGDTHKRALELIASRTSSDDPCRRLVDIARTALREAPTADLQVKDGVWRAIQELRKAIAVAERAGYGGHMLGMMGHTKEALHAVIKELS